MGIKEIEKTSPIHYSNILDNLHFSKFGYSLKILHIDDSRSRRILTKLFNNPNIPLN